MSLNWKEIDLVLEELQLAGTHIQRVSQPDFASLVLSLYRPSEPFDLYISLASGKTRLHRLSDSLRAPQKMQRFAQLLRSRCKGGRITQAYQVHGDRIVKLSVSAAEGVTILWIRLWGGAANIIATDEGGTILDAFYRRPARGEVSGGRFDPESETSPAPDARAGRRVYEVRDLPGSGDFNSRIEAYYRESVPRADVETLRADALRALERREARALSTIERLERTRRQHEGAERLRQLGDLLMSNLQSIHEGDRWARIESYYDENETVEIELDPTLRPERNAEAYYERYKKARSGWEKLGAEIDELKRNLEKLAAQRERIATVDDVKELRRLTGAGPKKHEATKEHKPTPGLQFWSSEHRIIVGRSASENDELLRRHVKGNDLWLHARDYPGAYVFIKNVPGKTVPLEVLLDAGNLALYYSKARTGGQAELYYTHVKYLRRPKEGKKGLVLPTQEKNLTVRLDSKRIDRLFRDREDKEMGI